MFMTLTVAGSSRQPMRLNKSLQVNEVWATRKKTEKGNVKKRWQQLYYQVKGPYKEWNMIFAELYQNETQQRDIKI